MKDKNVIFVNKYFFPDESATSLMLSDLAFGLSIAGHNVTVIASRQLYENSSARLPSRETTRGVAIMRIWSTRFGRKNVLGRAIDYMSFYAALFYTLIRVDSKLPTLVIVKTDPPLISIIVMCAAALNNFSYWNWLQDLFPEIGRALGVPLLRGGLFAVLKFFRNLSLKKASCNIVIGELMNREIRKISPAIRTAIVSNWQDETNISPVPKLKNKLALELDVENKFIVGYSGNLGRGHDYGTFLEALKMLKRNERILFVFFGGGQGYEALKAAASSAGCENVLFEPYQPKSALSRSLSLPDIHLLTLKPELEGLMVPSKIYGIAASGRAAIFVGDSNGEIANLLKEHKFGYSVDINDSTKLANLILDLSENPKQVSAMGKAARSAFDENYSKSRAIEKWTTLLEETCS